MEAHGGAVSAYPGSLVPMVDGEWWYIFCESCITNFLEKQKPNHYFFIKNVLLSFIVPKIVSCKIKIKWVMNETNNYCRKRHQTTLLLCKAGLLGLFFSLKLYIHPSHILFIFQWPRWLTSWWLEPLKTIEWPWLW